LYSDLAVYGLVWGGRKCLGTLARRAWLSAAWSIENMMGAAN